jgi:hypothetical protein
MTPLFYKNTTLRLMEKLDESQARWFVAREALNYGRGGISHLHLVTGLSRPTIRKGIQEILSRKPLGEEGRIRRNGGGRKRVEAQDSKWILDLERILDENTAGDPQCALRWTHKSTTVLAKELRSKGHEVSADTVGRRLHELDYTLQGNVKSLEGASPEERDSQFQYINRKAKEFWREGNPVVSVDTKKRELVGAFKNKGQTWRQKSKPTRVNVYDFRSLSQGVAIPYGAYDQKRNEGFVNVGTSHDTAEFAVESIRRWWRLVGGKHYPKAKRLLICADSGGSNGNRNNLWKVNLQRLAQEMRIAITVCHFPKGTSKWNKIEHRMFSFISLNWAGNPLVDYETIIGLISSTHTGKGLVVKAKLDKHPYDTGVKVTEEELRSVHLERHRINPEWNYTISPS